MGRREQKCSTSIPLRNPKGSISLDLLTTLDPLHQSLSAWIHENVLLVGLKTTSPPGPLNQLKSHSHRMGYSWTQVQCQRLAHASVRSWHPDYFTWNKRWIILRPCSHRHLAEYKRKSINPRMPACWRVE